MSALVSVIIPCYNAQRWVAAAIESCLQQTYPHLEIIVVDDGSTDGSLAEIEKFRGRITIESGPNRGAAGARNRAFELATGDYIQYLDADDYLLPDKIERHLTYLEQSGVDGVYGDWQHLTNFPDGREAFDAIHEADAHDDLLAANLQGWWVPPYTLLYKREAVEKSGGWDQTTVPADDRDFFLSVLLSGATLHYLPGNCGIYRRYGNVTLSTSSTEKWVRGHIRTLDKVIDALTATGQLAQYRTGLAHSYYLIAHGSYDLNKSLHRELLAKVTFFDPTFRPDKPSYYHLIQRMFGLAAAEEVAGLKRRITGKTNVQ